MNCCNSQMIRWVAAAEGEDQVLSALRLVGERGLGKIDLY